MCQSCQADRGQSGGHARRHVGAGYADVLEAESHFVLDGEHGELATWVLEDDADPFGKLACHVQSRGFAVHLDRSR